MSNPLITITESAQDYLAELLEKQKEKGTSVRIFLEKAGTPQAECCMSYYAPDEVKDSDFVIKYEKFNTYVDAVSKPFLQDAVVDFDKDKMGGQLTFKAPNAKIPNLTEDASLEDRINYVLNAEINPSLAAHGGSVSLVTLTDDNSTAILQFGGGCQGCSAVDMTLKQSVERTLLEQITELKKITDVTDHSRTENAYY